MRLNTTEREAIERGDIVRYVIPESQTECVLIRGDLLDPIRARADFSPCDSDELLPLVAEVLDDEDWTQPGEPACI